MSRAYVTADLTRQLNVSPRVVEGVVSELVDLRLVLRGEKISNRQETTLQITSQGNHLLQAVESEIATQTARAAQGVATEDLIATARTLRQMYSVLDSNDADDNDRKR